MLISLSWKNVFRNKFRSSLVIFSIASGLTGGIFYMAFSNGMAQEQISNSINTYVSNIQIQNPKYLLNDEIEYRIRNVKDKISKISQLPEVKGVCSRLRLQAMIATAETGTGVYVYGVDPQTEKQVTDIHSKVYAGKYFNPKIKNPIVLGKKLAEKLNVKPKSKVVITLQDTEGNITSGLFRVAGIFDAHNSIFEEGNVFVRKKDLANLIEINPTEATEIAILLKHNDLTKSVANKIKQIFAQEIKSGELAVRTWDEIEPMLKMINQMTMEFNMIFLMIILVAVGFGVVNTMLMSVMERKREIGVLMAIGMNRGKVFLMILLETFFLSFTGAFAGITLAAVIIVITNKIGIDLSELSKGLSSWGYSPIVRPELHAEYYFLIALLIILAAFVASIFPARKALKINPAEATRL